METIGLQILQLLAILMAASFALLLGVRRARESGVGATVPMPELVAGLVVVAVKRIRPQVGSVADAPSRAPPGRPAPWPFNRSRTVLLVR